MLKDRERERGRERSVERNRVYIQSMQRQRDYVHQRTSCGINFSTHLYSQTTNSFIDSSTILLESNNIQVTKDEIYSATQLNLLGKRHLLYTLLITNDCSYNSIRLLTATSVSVCQTTLVPSRIFIDRRSTLNFHSRIIEDRTSIPPFSQEGTYANDLSSDIQTAF